MYIVSSPLPTIGSFAKAGNPVLCKYMGGFLTEQTKPSRQEAKDAKIL
ncbi:hypothetical protein [Prevotella fusca]|nr:hypothetical protein [Prevotella fusca]